MYIVDCVPITRGALRGSLTYFTSKKVTSGTIVTVPIRKKTTQAVVTDIQPLSKVKQDIRLLSYKIQKIEKIETKDFFTESFIKAVKNTNEYYLGSMSNTLELLTPKTILENLDKIKYKKSKKSKKQTSNTLWLDKIAIQEKDVDRLSFYKRKIRESFARKESVFLCFPTLSDIEQVLESFEKGIQKYTIVLHSYLPKKKLIENWQKALNEKHPVLIIGTATFLCLPREDIGTVIIDKESSPAYKYKKMPYVDTQYFAEQFAKENKITLILGDVVLRTETIYEKESGNMHPSSEIKYRFLSEAEQIKIDMRKYRGDKTSFKIISSELEDILKKAVKNNENTFVYVNRKGLSPYTICADCGNIHKCEECNGLLVLYKNQTEVKIQDIIKPIKTFFMCHSCGKVYSSNSTCGICNSWRLVPLGIGIEKFESEIKKILPKTKIYKIESNSVKSFKKGIQILSQFNNSPGSILLGTEMALLYIRNQVDNIAVGSMDNLFSVPDYRINERMLNILMRLRILSNKKFVIQTRNPEHIVFDSVISGNLLEFYRNEIFERKNFLYPPFTVLIKITKEDKNESIWDEMKKITEYLSPFNPILYQTQYGVRKNFIRLNILIKIKRGNWPQKNLSEYLQSLPLQYKIIVNPAEIL